VLLRAGWRVRNSPGGLQAERDEDGQSLQVELGEAEPPPTRRQRLLVLSNEGASQTPSPAASSGALPT
jgi:hypothetical protein